MSAPAARGPRAKLSRPRDIGWSMWDPIGLLPGGETWDGKPCADEYDGQFIRAAGLLRRGATPEAVAACLISMKTDRTGPAPRPDATARAMAAAMAILKDGGLRPVGTGAAPDDRSALWSGDPAGA